MVAILQCEAVAVGWIRMDRFRLPRRALAGSVAQHQFAIRNRGHLRLPEGFVLLLPIVVDFETCAAHLSSLELARHGRQGNRSVGVFEPRPRGAFPEWKEPRGEGCQEGFACRLGREIRTGFDRGARLERRETGDDDEARNDWAGRKVGVAL